MILGGSRGRCDGWGAGETLWVSLGFTKGAEQGSQMRSARGKQLLRLQWFCAPAWLRVGAGSTFGARGFEGQPLGEGEAEGGSGVPQRESVLARVGGHSSLWVCLCACLEGVCVCVCVCVRVCERDQDCL